MIQPAGTEARGQFRLTDFDRFKVRIDGGTLLVPDAIDFLGGRLEGSGTVVGDVNFSGLGTKIAPGFTMDGALALTEVLEPPAMMSLVAIGGIQLSR